MLFLTLSNADMQFVEKELKWKSYTTAEVSPVTKMVELIDRREFAVEALNLNAETFEVHLSFSIKN